MKLLQKNPTTRLIFFMVADAISIIFAVVLAFLIRFDGSIPAQYVDELVRLVVLFIITVIPVFYAQRLYFFSWSYVGTSEILSLIKATTFVFVFLSAFIYFSNHFSSLLNFSYFPRSVIIISYILLIAFASGIRLYKRIYSYVTREEVFMKKDKTLIVGAGDAGEQILRNMLSSQGGHYFPVGFVDDSEFKQKVKIHGVNVLGKIADIPNIVEKYDVKQLVIALPSASNKIIREAVTLGKKAGLWKIKIAPPMNEIIRGEVSLKNLKAVDVEDLLGRDSVTLDKREIEQCIGNKVVLITGAAGSIGSELSHQVAKFQPTTLVLLDQDETGIFNVSKDLKSKFPSLHFESIVADVTDKEKLGQLFGRIRPNIVFHAAAYKHVPLMEQHSDEAVKNNVFGTKNLAEVSIDKGVEKFIFISTDKAINPTSVMGATKRIGEMICQSMSQYQKTAFISVRFGNVLNSRGSVIPIFKDQIAKGGPVQVTDPEMKRYFMLISEACLLVMQAGAMGKGGEVFVLDMGEPVKIVDLAKEMIKLSGFKPDEDIAIVFTGIRPGEKLFEEIMTDEERTAKTHNQKIFMAKLANINAAEFAEHLELLNRASMAGDKEQLRELIKTLIPSFAGAQTRQEA